MSKRVYKNDEWDDDDYGRVDRKRYDRKKRAIKEARKNKFNKQEAYFEEDD